MKRRDLEKKLKEAGWYLLRNGADHDIWTNGKNIEPIPRHKEINERLAKAILRKLGL
ncbi:MAG: type II toxin-antitoxin system HicA family toxin [Bacillota bacterium]|nr:type II toxin-antitoxin system HicA family toxin [Bacillota bacterium]